MHGALVVVHAQFFNDIELVTSNPCSCLQCSSPAGRFTRRNDVSTRTPLVAHSDRYRGGTSTRTRIPRPKHSRTTVSPVGWKARGSRAP